MHGAVVTHTLHVCHTSGVISRGFDADLVLHAGILHLAADERTSVGLVGLAAVSVASLADCQDGRVGGVLVVDLGILGLGGLDGGCVHRDWWGRRLEGTETAGEFLHGHLCVGAVQHTEFTVLLAEASELVFGF